MTTKEVFDAPVLVVGGGSTGLSLAAELGWRGTQCLLVEAALDVNPHPRANALGNRSMEYFRRWGVDKKLTGAGVPADYPAAYFWVSKLDGREIHSLRLPGHAELEAVRASTVVDPTHELHWSPYLKTIVGQHLVEGVLRNHVAECESVDAWYGWKLVDFDEQGQHVLAQVRSTVTGEQRTVRCEWLVGCDGGRSLVREKLGYSLEGRGGLARFVSIYFHAPELMSCHGFGPANIYFPIHRKYRGFLLNWNTGTTWTYHLILEPGTDWQQIVPEDAIRAVVGRDTPLDVVSVQPWTAHALTAKRYRSTSGRAFLAGDAAHLFTPTGGLGMNTGVSDAIDLAWKLSACVEGWGGPELLASYEVERRPIGIRNTAEAADNFDRLFSVMQHGDELEAESPEAEKLRADLKAELSSQEKLLKSSGILLGYRYEGSPICISDGTPATPDHPQQYVPTARPGHRAPHAWLSDGRSILDVLGKWFTLICFDGLTTDAQALRSAFKAQGIPLTLVEVREPAIRHLYGDRALVLVRPDMMVVWRADAVSDAEAIAETVRGGAS